MSDSNRVIPRQIRPLTNRDLALVGERQHVFGKLETVFATFDTQLIGLGYIHADLQREARAQEAESGVFPRGDKARQLCAAARRYLAVPASEAEVARAVAVLCKGIKFAGRGVIPSPAGFIRTMLYFLADAQLPAAVLYTAVGELIRGEKWMPSTAEVLDTAKAVMARSLAAIELLELPPHDQFTLAYHVQMRIISRTQAMANLARIARQRRAYPGYRPPLIEDEPETYSSGNDGDYDC